MHLQGANEPLCHIYPLVQFQAYCYTADSDWQTDTDNVYCIVASFFFFFFQYIADVKYIYNDSVKTGEVKMSNKEVTNWWDLVNTNLL